MRRFLYISFTSEQSFTGGLQCSHRNLQSIEELFGKEYVDSYIIRPYQNRNFLSTKIKRIYDIFQGYFTNKRNMNKLELHSFEMVAAGVFETIW